MKGFAERFDLPTPPRRIEVYDNSATFREPMPSAP
jgi:excinuclease UvrABC nuclease subunit